MRRILRPEMVLFSVVSLGIIGLSGCASVAHPGQSSSAVVTASEQENNMVGLPAPIAITLATAQGSTVEIPLGNAAYIVVPDGSETSYTIDSSDPGILRATAGSDEGGVVLRPGLTSVAPGEAKVSLTDRKSGQVTDFRVVVAPK